MEITESPPLVVKGVDCVSSGLIISLIKHLLYIRQQIPSPYDELKNLVEQVQLLVL
jgi:hypothetical protein